MAKKKTVVSLLATMALSTAAGVVALNVNTGVDSISANAATTSTITFKDSAAIRLSATDTGIRYTAYLDESLLNVGDTVSFKDVTVGMLIVPSKVVEDLTDDYIAQLVAGYGKTEDSFTTTFEDRQIQSETVDGVTKYYVCGAITEITDVNYNETFRAVAYYKNAAGDVFYSEQKSDACTIAYVADQAFVDGTADGLTDGAKTTLGDILEKSVTLATQDVEISCYVGGTVDLSSYFDEITGETYAVTAGDATLNGSILTLNAAETATVTVTAHGGYVSVPVNVTVKEATKLASANVSETEVITGRKGTSFADGAAITSTATSFVLDMSDKASEIVGTLKSVTVDGTNYTDVSYADGKVTVNATVPVTVYGEKSYTAYFESDNEQIEVSGKTLFITLKISDTQELQSWAQFGHEASGCSSHENTKCFVNGYFVMDADIYCTANVTTDTIIAGGWYGYCFDGVFDGRGYNIDGYASGEWHSFIYRLGEYGTIRNISFTNVDRTKQIAPILLHDNWGEENTRTIENIYVHYNNFVANGKTLLVGGGANSNIEYKNIVVTAAKTSGTTASSVVNTTTVNEGKVSNVYAIGLGDYAKINTADTESARNDVDVFATYASKAGAANNDYSAFTATDFWKLDGDGVPYPKKLGALYTVQFIVDGATVSDVIMIEGRTLTIPANPEKSGYAFAGWALNGGDTAYDFDANGKVVTADMTFTALWEASVESANVSENEIVTAIANAGTGATIATHASSYAIDVSDVNPAGELTALTVGSNTYGSNDFSYENGVITVNQGMAISVYGLQNYTAKFVGNGATTVVSGKVLFVTMEITTVDEFNSMGAIGNAVYQANGGATAGWYQGYFTLGANISYNGSYANYAGEDNTVFSGTFDGRGYTIDGVTTPAGGMFGKVTGDVVIKNFALTNATNHKTANFCGLFTKHFEGTAASLTFENIYIHMKTLYIHGASFQTGILGCTGVSWGDGANALGMTCTNIIVTVDETSGTVTEGTGRKTYVVGTASPTASTLTNVYTYNTGSLTVVNGTTTGSAGTYADKATFNAAITAETAKAFTDTGYWTYDATNGLAFVVKA